ncbi:hypothetical protein BpHYR1_014467 [Brachionus plicatilis]|uniref:Uncharacterized protein n=1 Tax=Brachionus plicatilis TaxID=10195 RepID=A0A3M7PYU1_BRAPC|nr:hypothetical protein BpHYR1_014467 [Brachionus plicatilis]
MVNSNHHTSIVHEHVNVILVGWNGDLVLSFSHLISGLGLFFGLLFEDLNEDQHYDLHKNFYQYLLHQDIFNFFSKSGYINRPLRARLTARNLEATNLLVSNMDLLSH